MTDRNSGFTLIELIVVIVILGILAATALPRFVNLQNDARAASVQGLAGGMRAAADLVRGRWLAAGSTGAGPVDIGGGTTVNVAASGYPAATNLGIEAALNLSGGSYAFTHTAPTSSVIPTGAPATCSATYTETNGQVTVNASAANC